MTTADLLYQAADRLSAPGASLTLTVSRRREEETTDVDPAPLAAWLNSEASAWNEDRDTYWLHTAAAWDQANDHPMGDDLHAHLITTAAEYANGRHRPALAVAHTVLGGMTE